ncbi:MAG TPA: ATP-dependent RNA helicase HrpA, partial [Actinomycetaceae bacterium]|nr:ATP-dependent RNA helicase HrpA [Actinomycetaceae bacterium]
DIAAAIRDNQVVIVAGETGSGKTTQLPKICLELGRGITGTIGHTQPRRIAARTVAERIAVELGVAMGGAVGYQVRFTDAVGPTTLVKLMTDGILLAEIQQDPLLRRYDTLIIDEAHERSLNIDFILGYLADLLPRRPDLKVIITSATIDSERFAAHFAQPGPDGETQPAPIVEVSGRTYPVEIRYRPLVADAPRADAEGRADGEGRAHSQPAAVHAPDDAGEVPDVNAPGAEPGLTAPSPYEGLDQPAAICQAVEELMAEGPGDILVFLSGEREIRDAHVALAEHLGPRYVAPGEGRGMPASHVEVIPLYARLSAAEQHRVFEAHTTRRVVLATNVAETSLTVPGIHYVIDPGTARISRYSNRTKVQRLPIEAISQASANQRAGRSGRVADGICIRLYSQADFESRPEFTEPEILRTSLASVILQMASLDLGAVEDFPFVDKPDVRAVRDGVQLLTEIGALTLEGSERRLTTVGRQLARLPIDPRLGRMLLAAQENGCAAEVMIIVAALSVQDVRERPSEHRDAADAKHRRFTDPTSDFLAYLNLWRYLRTQQRDLSGSAFRRMCRAEFLNYLRIREWQDVVAQLRQLAKPLGLTMRPLTLPHPTDIEGDPAAAAVAVGRSADAASAEAVHRSLLVGLLSNLGTYDERRRDYQGARGSRFVVWPGSGLARKTYDWVMAAELVETSRLFARTVARIDPAWVEPLAAHLVRKVHSEPYWSRRHGAAMVHEKVLLYGMTLVADRAVPLARLGTPEARELARELFIRHALVEGDWRSHHAFVARNAELLAEAEEQASRRRRHDLVLDEQGRYDFYDERLPDDVVGARHFDAWWKKQRRTEPDLLTFTPEILLPAAHELDPEDFPDVWQQGDLTLPLTYQFDPGADADGVTVHIPLSVLARVRPEGFDWLVPGLLPELIVAAIRMLPKKIRVQLVPAPDVAREIAGMLPAWHDVAPAPFGAPSFAEAFASVVHMLRDVTIPPEAWDEERLPAHLRMTFRVVDDRGATLGESTSLPLLQRQLAGDAEDAVSSAVTGAVAQAMAEAREREGRGRGRRGRRGAGGGTGRRGADGTEAEGRRGQPDGAAEPGAPEEGGARFRELEGLTTWPEVPEGVVPQRVESQGAAGLLVRGYPAVVDEAGPDGGRRVSLRVLGDAARQVHDHRRGLRRLLAGELALAVQRVTTRWTGQQALVLASSPYPNTEALVDDAQLAAAGGLVAAWEADHGLPWQEADWSALVAWARPQFEDAVHTVLRRAADTLAGQRDVEAAIKESTSMFLLDTLTDVREQVGELVYPGFVADTPPEQLEHLPRYLRAAVRRIERARDNVHQDAHHAWQITELREAYEQAQAAAEARHDLARLAELEGVRWLLEELRVSLFAQQLGTPVRVSAKRIRRLLD